MASSTLFKLVPKTVWYSQLVRYGRFVGMDEDVNFIHLCTEKQLSWVYENTFKKYPVCEQRELLKIDIDPTGLDIRWEKSLRTGIAYPHLYGSIPIDNIISTSYYKFDKLCTW